MKLAFNKLIFMFCLLFFLGGLVALRLLAHDALGPADEGLVEVLRIYNIIIVIIVVVIVMVIVILQTIVLIIILVLIITIIISLIMVIEVLLRLAVLLDLRGQHLHELHGAADRSAWAVTFIPMPMPKTVCKTHLHNKIVQLEVCRTFSDKGMGMNITAQCRSRARSPPRRGPRRAQGGRLRLPEHYSRDPDPEIRENKLPGTTCLIYVLYFLKEMVSGSGSLS